MSEDTNIEWADHTGSPFFGCACVSAGCANCYAMGLAQGRMLRIFRGAYFRAGFVDWESRPVWGDKATRVLASSFWADARRLNRLAGEAAAVDGVRVRPRMFPSLMDWLDEMPGGIIDQAGKVLSADVVRGDFLQLVHETPHLDWLLLTKRPENFGRLVAQAIGGMRSEGARAMAAAWLDDRSPGNVWFGFSAENQEQFRKRYHVAKHIAANVIFCSMEPLLGAIDFLDEVEDAEIVNSHYLDWVIVGGESGGGARGCNVEWIRRIVEQCRVSRVPVFVKQLGKLPFDGTNKKCESVDPQVLKDWRLKLKDPKGGDMAEWPKDLQVREFPKQP